MRFEIIHMLRNSFVRALKDLELINSVEFTQSCRAGNEHHFTRNRKMPPNDLMLSLINRKGLTMNIELREYMSIAHPDIKISNAGYHKQRMKMNPYAIEKLYKHHNYNFYHDQCNPNLEYKGHLVLAVDGTTIRIPSTEENLELYGCSTNNSDVGVAQMGLGCLYDVRNRMILDVAVCPYRFNDMRIAVEQITDVKTTIGEKPYIVLMDRGYSTLFAFLWMEACGISFVARLSSNTLKKEQASMQTDDEDIEIDISKSRLRNLEQHNITEWISPFPDLNKSYSLRFIRVQLSDDICEILLTNLPRDEFPKEDFSNIYHMRWGIETAFRVLKSHLKFENFSGIRNTIILQDIFSTIYVSNLAEDIARDIEIEQQSHLENDYKHKMAINRNINIGLLKKELIFILLEEDPDVQETMLNELYNEISSSLVPIRPGRTYNRSRRTYCLRYPNNNKRSY